MTATELCRHILTVASRKFVIKTKGLVKYTNAFLDEFNIAARIESYTEERLSQRNNDKTDDDSTTLGGSPNLQEKSPNEESQQQTTAKSNQEPPPPPTANTMRMDLTSLTEGEDKSMSTAIPTKDTRKPPPPNSDYGTNLISPRHHST
jgi:hypothetical protein